jgi:hypothetical protein
MSLLQRRNELQNKPTEAEPENDENDGENEYCPEITREEGKSCLHLTWRVNCVPPAKHRFGWLQSMSIRNSGF